MKTISPKYHSTVLQVASSNIQKTLHLHHYLEIAWLYTHAALWPGHYLTTQEIIRFKRLLEAYFKEKGCTAKNLAAFRKRINVLRSTSANHRLPLCWQPLNQRCVSSLKD